MQKGKLTKFHSALLVSSLVFSFILSSSFGQEQPPRFEVRVDFVEVDVVVTDRGGNRVMDLGVEDFEILEEGEVQEVASLRMINIPAKADVSPPVSIATDVATNRLPEGGRLYVLVLDSLHISSRWTGRARRIAREFIEQWVAPGDLAAVVATSVGQSAQPLTDNRALLLEAVDMFQGDRLPSPTIATAERQAEQAQMVNPLTGAPAIGVGREASPDKFDVERAFRVRRMLQTLRGVGELLGSVEGRRKAILFVSEGIDYDLYGLVAPNTPGADFMNRGPMGPAIVAEIRRTIGEAARSNTAIYCLDPGGLTSGLQGITEARSRPVSPTALYAERHQRFDNLRVLSGETGGLAVLNKNDYADSFRQVVEDTSRYYLLGYHPTNQEQDGEYRTIRVKVKRPGLEVRARKGYVARSPERLLEAEAEIDEEAEDLFNPMELSEIPLRVAAGALQLDGRDAAVPIIVEMGIDGFEFTGEEGKLRDGVELTAIALDQQGQVVASEKRRLDIFVSSRLRDLMRVHRFRAMTRLDLPAGTYQLRLMVREEGAGKKGTVHFDLEIPDCSGKSLSMGGIFVGSLRQSFIPVSIGAEEKRDFAFAPSTVRIFAPDDELLVQTEVCLSGESLVVETDVRGIDGSLLSRNATSYEVRESTLRHRTRIPLDDLGTGSYLLQLTARDPAGGAEAVRQIAFEISP